METMADIMNRYTKSGSSIRVDIVCKYYPQIDGIIDGRIAGMKYTIWEEKEKKKRVDKCELGIRVQSGNSYSDPTGNEATFRADLESSIRNCDFSGGVLDGIDHPERIIKEAYVLRHMKQIQTLYGMQLRGLIISDQTMFLQYLNRDITLADIADKRGIEYSSASKRIVRIKKKLKQEVIEIMDSSSCQIDTNYDSQED